jgi:hypothetical protein
VTQVTDRGGGHAARSASARRSRSGRERVVRHRVERRQQQRVRQRRRGAVLALLAVTLLLVGVDLTNGLRGSSAATEAPPSKQPAAPAPIAGPASPSVAPSTRESPAPAGVVDQGAGTFTVAPGGTGVVGTGKLLTYRVEVENGINQDAAAFAAAVDTILDDPRSWTAGRQWSFQRISAGTPGVTVRLASPKTVDRLCYPLDTEGYTSCRVGNNVVINLARWLTAVPDFAGHLPEYRQYAVNHEVGHRLGHGHMACPAPGQLAPVMQQQTLGLKGCRLNPWPYVNGQLVTGPAVP